MEKTAVIPWDREMAAQRLRVRRRWMAVGCAIGLCVAGSILLDHVLGSGGRGDDWSEFDGRQVYVVSADDGQTISVRRGGSGPITQVHLLGVAAASGRWAEKSKEFLSSSLTGRTVTLKLEPTQTRDLRGRLLASVFLEPRQSISADVVGLGLARADRHIPYSFHGAVERAESEARKKHRGLWSALHPV